MTKFQEKTLVSVGQLNTSLKLARETATDAQADNLAMAAELFKLRGAQHSEDNTHTPQDARKSGHAERLMDVDMDRTALSTLQIEDPPLPQASEAPQEQALVIYKAAANNNEDVEYAEEENDDGDIRGGDEDEHADDESEDQSVGEADYEDEDVDMREVRDRLRPDSARANNRQPMKYVEVSDDGSDAAHGSDISMDEDATTSPLRRKGPATGGIERQGNAVRIPLSQVPRPQHFSRPRSGAGPIATIRVGLSNAAPTTPSSRASLPIKGRGNARDLRRKVDHAREWYRKKGSSQNLGINNAEGRGSGRTDRPSRRLRVFDVVPLRGTDIDRTQLLKNVDLLMNELMDMSTYDDIIDATLADDAEAREFAQGDGNPPALEPLRPYFGRGFKKHLWNRRLEELFIQYYEDKMQVELDQKAQDTIADMFMERIERLRRKYRDLTKDIPDGEREAREEIKMAKGRRNTRRVNKLFDVRRGVCLESIQKPDGTEDKGWRLLLEMVHQLGSYGMSSDESEADEKGYIRYNIRQRLWRSREVSDRLEVIDSARNTTNAKGKRLAGNSARERIRSSKNAATYYGLRRVMFLDDDITMPSSAQFNYSRGSAFVHEGYLYYSPNSRRTVVIPPPPLGYGQPPFQKRRLNAADFRQPVWWSEPWGWLSFVPLAPNFLSYPFEPLSWLPKIVEVEVSANPNSSDPRCRKTCYTLAYDDHHLWMQKEQQLYDAAHLLRVRHGICGSPPPLPSEFGFHRNHKSRAIAQKMASLAWYWFGIWMGYLAYMVQQTLASPYQQPDTDIPDPYWYQPLLKGNKFSRAWLDGLASSPVCQFGESVARAGVVIPWTVVDKSRPTIEFFLDCDVPVFFPWTSTTENAIRGNASLAHLRPPVELIQGALTFILKSPNDTPLAALIMKRFCGLNSEISNRETADVLRLQFASSEVVAFVRKHFLAQYDLLAQYKDKPDADRALHQAMDAHYQQNIQKAHTAAALPQQGMIERDGQQNLFADWKDFFRKQATRMSEIRKGASSKDLEAFANRKRQPPQKRTHMFTWEQVVTAGGVSLWSRKKVDQRNFDDLLEEENPHVYNEVLNEWDIFPEFMWDKTSPPEDGVPSVCSAPPLAGRAVAYGSDDDDDEYDSDGHISVESFDMYAPLSRRRQDPPMPLHSNQSHSDQSGHHPPATGQSSSYQRAAAAVSPDTDQSCTGQSAASPLVSVQPSPSRRADSPPWDPHPPRSAQSAPRSPVNFCSSTDSNDMSRCSPVAPASHMAAPDDQQNGSLEEDISSHTPLLQALQYNYGYTRGVHTLPSSTPKLDWKGVGKTLGYMTSLPSDDEDLSIRHFVSCLASKQAPPMDMIDLSGCNFSSLNAVFDFRNIVRPQTDVFVFVELSSRSPSCDDWLLSVRSPLAALYVVRYVSSNPGHTALTVAHRLAKYGIAFNTLRLCPSSPLSPSRTPFIPRYRFSDHCFTAADFESAMLTCKARLQGPAGRAALLQGGIIARIAREFVSIEAVLDGPSAGAVEKSLGLVVDSESFDHQYRDDALSEEDIYLICGSYTVYTGRGQQTSQLSYFPRPCDWDHKNGFAWLEWTNASEELFQSIMTKNKDGRNPLKPSKWRDELRGFGYTRHLLEANRARSTSFVDHHCPVRSRR
ncbi:hypothetical protein D9619_013349 [Psilocybe cf. subviscida]|uniref:Uncharacterized protein n=1 Tax=Psilocybe cf. subviscida TaxID=2480587 RepID=A0A8H5F9Q3_9AGAR|nr:hypothetical protein D9619_013349 [Psilocybe cf. subviscida]